MYSFSIILCLIVFQFHKGTIRTKLFKDPTNLINSFQFHKGTIRTCSLSGGCSLVSRFQFHKGTIRTCTARLDSFFSIHFNSIKVRLELSFCVVKIHFKQFQFHKGTIRTFILHVIRPTQKNFNSIKVRLEHHVRCSPERCS